MQASIRLGRIFGMDIGIHYSWFIIAILLATMLVGHFAAMHPDWSPPLIFSVALITDLLFFVSIVVHEMSHALVARAFKVPVHSITLFALGGVANIEKEATSPKAEFLVGIVGPVTSFLIGLLCLFGASAIAWPPLTSNSPFVAALLWLSYINVALAVFNMLPGFPMDGGRVIRAIIWWVTKNADKATKIASRIGQIVAFLLAAYGLIQFFTTGSLSGLWLILIGWFIGEAAQASYSRVSVMSSLKGLRARDLMSQEVPVVESDLTLSMFFEDHLLKTWHRGYVVETADGKMAGLITPHDLKLIEKSHWANQTVGDTMIPLAKLHTIDPDAPATDALEAMAKEDIGQLPVVSEGKLIGMLNRSNVLEAIHTRTELGV